MAREAIDATFLVDWCDITDRRGGGGTLDRTTGTVTMTEGRLVYEGPCHISSLQSKRETGGLDASVTDEHTLRLAVDAAPIPVGSVARIRGFEGEEWAEFHVVRSPPRSVEFSAHVIVTRRSPQALTGSPS